MSRSEQYDQIKTNADAAEAVVDADKAAVDNAKVQLSYCYIYSPVSGRVGSFVGQRRKLGSGQRRRAAGGHQSNQSNQCHLFRARAAFGRSSNGIWLRGKLKSDARFQSDEGRPEQGVLAFVDNAVDRTTGHDQTKAEFKNQERRLWPGQFVNVALTLCDAGGRRGRSVGGDSGRAGRPTSFRRQRGQASRSQAGHGRADSTKAKR